MGKEWKWCQTLFFWAPRSLQMVIAAMKLKDTGVAVSWPKESRAGTGELVSLCSFSSSFQQLRFPLLGLLAQVVKRFG